MQYYLVKMLDIYEPDGYDWMNFSITNGNKISFHHIEKRENGGKSRPCNGAILTKWSHRFLHYLEYICPDAFNDFQDLFRRINASNAPRTQEHVNEVDAIIYNILNGGYTFKKQIDIEEMGIYFLRNYCDDIKIKGKSLVK